jgi:hypothetical protein
VTRISNLFSHINIEKQPQGNVTQLLMVKHVLVTEIIQKIIIDLKIKICLFN